MSVSTERYKQVQTSSGHTYNYYSTASEFKTTLIWIHGFPYTSKIWRHQIAHFEKLGYGCIAPDILGHGKTSKPLNPAEYVGPVAARSMMDILDKEGIERAVVIGHDWGSVIASRCALLYPARVQVLVLVNIGYFKPGPFNVDAINDMTEQAVGASTFGYWDVFLNSPKLLTEHIESTWDLFFAKDTQAWVKHFTARGVFRKWLTEDGRCETIPEIEEADRQDFLDNNWEAALQYYHCFAKGHNSEAEKDIPEDSRMLTVPTLQVAATSDGAAPLPVVQGAMGDLKDGKLVIIEGDHHAFLEHQDDFNSELETYFKEKGVKP